MGVHGIPSALQSAAAAFNLNIVRFKNFRTRMMHAYDREGGALRETMQTFQREAEVYFRLREPVEVRDYFIAPSARRLGENALSWATIVERQLANIPGEVAVGREMAFVYLMAIFDGFVGRWRVDMGLDPNEG